MRPSHKDLLGSRQAPLWMLCWLKVLHADLGSEDFALHGETCSAAVYTLLLVYAESFRRPNAVLLKTFDVLLFSDETTVYTEPTHVHLSNDVTAMLNAGTGCSQTCQIITLLMPFSLLNVVVTSQFVDGCLELRVWLANYTRQLLGRAIKDFINKKS